MYPSILVTYAQTMGQSIKCFYWIMWTIWVMADNLLFGLDTGDEETIPILRKVWQPKSWNIYIKATDYMAIHHAMDTLQKHFWLGLKGDWREKGYFCCKFSCLDLLSSLQKYSQGKLKESCKVALVHQNSKPQGSTLQIRKLVVSINCW